MLKALELVGFKSFADKTRFEFPKGITAVVGPNGSGKSNVVDSIKWVLGEQSVKSLRGHEMADVIFNGAGAGSSARRPLNAAEVTLTLDNSAGLLAVDTPEVHITRRVYRSGEGEYLINRQPCRLRDVRELLAGTGMGTQAYSVIEQGKVDGLLQASPKDRRTIFEEAAGISRFKAKKLEALRRMERVEQNLLRLSDIVDEVESRLRSVRLQAGKARRYRDYSQRLQTLRTQVAAVDWFRLSQRLARLEEAVCQLTGERDAAAIEAQQAETQVLVCETQVASVVECMRQVEASAAENRERIAARESAIEHERQRQRDLEGEIDRQRRQFTALKARAGELQQQMSVTGSEVAAAETQYREIAARLAESERQLSDALQKLDHLRAEDQQRRAALMEQVRQAALLGNQASGLEGRLAAADDARGRAERRLAEIGQQQAAMSEELQRLRQELQRRNAEAETQARLLAEARERLSDYQAQHQNRASDLAEMRERHSRVVERIAVLDELEKRHEGVGAGVREILDLARDAQGPLGEVEGLVADLFQVSVEMAPVVEVALGQRAQYVVARQSPRLLEFLGQRAVTLAGRVGFLWLDGHASDSAPGADLSFQAGVVGRADRFVQCDRAFTPLAGRLLGRTWVVETLERALSLAGTYPGWSFVTVAGELVSADGTLVVGPRDAAAGLISRKSQLRALRQQQSELEDRVAQIRAAIGKLQGQIDQQNLKIEELAAVHRLAADAAGEHRYRVAAAEERGAEIVSEKAAVDAERNEALAEHERAAGLLAAVQEEKREAERTASEMEAGLSGLARQVAALDEEQQSRNRQTMEVKIDLAKCEERLGNLRSRLGQYEESQEERLRAIEETRQQLAGVLRRLEESSRSILQAESEVAGLYLRKEACAAEVVQHADRRAELQQTRGELSEQVQKARGRAHRVEEKLHQKELETSEVRHDRLSLAARLREDYQIELAELEHEPSEEQQREREGVQQEIDDLRRKINGLGNVNLEALEELDQLETRFETLSGQFKDLTAAKNSLARILDKINTDSRRLFAETMETIRGHFQQLFRDLFGGGRADIVLEDADDILESGIEVVAKPPGKELQSISLLSGGEKTMTCVALLLAVFRSRPSPFCVLDEVDAALDEANIGRFTGVLTDFLQWTQFIIITHSKKTMSCAHSVYGVTMQESGVSKQVSVRFEDVSDTGEILREAPSPQPASSGDGQQAA